VNKIKIGILGIGNMGCSHAGYIRDGKCPELEITAICDNNPQRLAWAKTQSNGQSITYFDDAIAMLDSGRIDGCIIAVPHYEHVKYAIACMERGIHVMLEKPAGVLSSQVRKMNAVSENHPEVVFGLMFNQRTNCLYRKLHQLVHSGDYGQIRRTNWIITNWYRTQAYYDSGAWRGTWSGEGGGILMNQAPHQLDRARLLVEKGKLFLEEYEMTDREFNTVNKNPYGKVKTTLQEVPTDGENPQHPGVLNAWAAAILRNEPLVAEGKEGIHALTLSNAMHLSAFLGKEVQIPFDEDLYEKELMKRVETSRKKETQPVFVNDRDSYGYGSTH